MKKKAEERLSVPASGKDPIPFLELPYLEDFEADRRALTVRKLEVHKEIYERYAIAKQLKKV